MKVTATSESHDKFRGLNVSEKDIMKLRIVKDSDNKYRVQYQVKRFIFFGKLVWKYVYNLADVPWETDYIEEAKELIKKFQGKQEIIYES